uniref:Ig-like domain-containing protein n=1 Tax=Gasterosteus aculeatus aculeatus TaxID=481459 RepID=A0AAQ4R8N1_GASAC
MFNSTTKITQLKTEENSVEDTTVTLSYIYSSQAAGSDYFFWYRQYPGIPLELLISHSATGTVGIHRIHRLMIKVDGNRIIKADNLQWYRQNPGSSPQFLLLITDTQQTQVHLKIPSATVSDSAVYYCAVRPTLIGVIFGAGPRLQHPLLLYPCKYLPNPPPVSLTHSKHHPPNPFLFFPFSSPLSFYLFCRVLKRFTVPGHHSGSSEVAPHHPLDRLNGSTYNCSSLANKICKTILLVP